MGRQHGDMWVRVVPSDHPRSFIDGGRQFVRKGVKSKPPQKNETSLHTTQAKPRKIKMQAEKGYLGLRRRGGEQLGVDLDAVLLPLAPHLRRRPPYHGGRAAPARRLRVGKSKGTTIPLEEKTKRSKHS